MGLSTSDPIHVEGNAATPARGCTDEEPAEGRTDCLLNCVISFSTWSRPGDDSAAGAEEADTGGLTGLCWALVGDCWGWTFGCGTGVAGGPGFVTAADLVAGGAITRQICSVGFIAKTGAWLKATLHVLIVRHSMSTAKTKNMVAKKMLLSWVDNDTKL